MAKSAGNNAERAAATTAMLLRKTEFLEQCIYRGEVPTGITIPDSLTKLRKWVDETHKMEVIGSPSSTNVLKSPHNAKLIERAQNAVNGIRRLRSAKGKRKRTPLAFKLAHTQQQLKTERELTARLTSQLLALRADMNQALTSAHDAQRAKERVDARVAELTRQLADLKVRPIHEIPRS